MLFTIFFRAIRLLVIAKENSLRQPAVAADLEALRHGINLGDVLSREVPAVEAKVTDNALLVNRLGDDAPALGDAPLEEDLLGALVESIGDVEQGLVGVEGGVGASEARVAGRVDALSGVEGNELGRRVARMQLDLVDGRDDLGVGVSEQLLEVGDGEVGDTNVLGLARGQHLLHLAPRVDVVPVVMDLLVVAGDERAGPVDQIQVDVVGAQVLEGVVNGLGHALVVRVVELGGQPDLVAGHAGGLDAVADFLLVAVGGGSVDVAVTSLEGGLDGSVDLVGLGLPRAEADGGDLGARVEGEGAAVGLDKFLLAIVLLVWFATGPAVDEVIWRPNREYQKERRCLLT